MSANARKIIAEYSEREVNSNRTLGSSHSDDIMAVDEVDQMIVEVHDDDDEVESYDKHSGMSLILMVNNMLQNADEETKQNYKDGHTNSNADYTLKSIYDVEQRASTIFSALWGANDVAEDQVDIYFKEPVREDVLPRPDVIDEATDPFTPRAGKALTWQHVNMVLNPTRRQRERGKTQPRKLLNDISGEVPPRQTTAILGPSGAGKTSLLNILAGRASSTKRITITADIRLNNYSVDPCDIEVRQMIAFVAQDDSLVGTQTPRESIRFSARLRLPRSTTAAELDGITSRMLSELGLTSCADTVVGHALLKGISGGERKRTSIGVELVVKPGMIFLDEPTSGLDSFSALQVCQVLKKVANAGATVMFTIHQPSSEVFFGFDQVILLNKGQVMYQGAVTEVAEYFTTRGYPCPQTYNPADWIMTVAQANPIEDLKKQGFFEERSRNLGEPFERAPGTDALGRTIHKQKSCKAASDQRPPGFWIQWTLLVRREFQKMFRDWPSFLARMGVATFQAFIMGSVFYGVGDSERTQMNISDHFGAIMILQTMALLGQAQPAIMAFPDERPVFVREFSTNHYGVLAYFFAKLLNEATLVGFQICWILSMAYNLVGFRGDFGLLYGITYMVAMCGGAMGVFIGAIAKGNRQVATQMAPIIIVPNMTFSGFFVAPENIPAFLRWIRWLAVLSYSLRVMVIVEFDNCSENPIELAQCDFMMDTVDADPNDTWWYWLGVFALFIGFRVGALWILAHHASVFL